MGISELIQSFTVFNVNAANHIIYAFSSNWYLFLIVGGAVATTVMSVMAKANTVVREEQNIL